MLKTASPLMQQIPDPGSVGEFKNGFVRDVAPISRAARVN
jgi:hypothetical protein